MGLELHLNSGVDVQGVPKLTRSIRNYALIFLILIAQFAQTEFWMPNGQPFKWKVLKFPVSFMLQYLNEIEIEEDVIPTGRWYTVHIIINQKE